jgi:membrane protein DedA with SNARE-associated domain
MTQLLQWVTTSIEVWGYPAIFAGMVLESANIPIPSELIFGFAGYLVYLGHLDFSLVVVVGVLGGLFGSIASYMIGYYKGQTFVRKYGKYVLLSPGKLALAQRWFDRYGLAATFFGRLLPFIRTFISLPAGFAKVDFRRFVLYTILGSIPWTIAIVNIGMALGENWQEINAVGHEIGVGIGVLVMVGLFFWLKKG